ncbi:rhomboid family intramembrane serine protease, partial [Halorubrum tibetense]
MATCDECGEYENLPYQCRRCGKTFCGEHRLPENHDCPGLSEWNDPEAVFDSGFDDIVEGGNRAADGGVADRVRRRVNRATSTGGIAGYFRGNATYVLLAAMWLTMIGQWVAIALGGGALHNRLFMLESTALWQVWTWVTAVFAHDPGGLFHIIANSIVLFFFGPLVERAVGSKKFVGFFLVAGMVAGLGHALVGLLTNAPVAVLGASGATFAILGVLTVWRPNLQILLFFIIPMKLKYLTWGTAVVSLAFVLDPSLAVAAGLDRIAHLAHLLGFVVGLVFGRQNEGLARSARGRGGVRAGGGIRGPG